MTIKNLNLNLNVDVDVDVDAAASAPWRAPGHTGVHI